MIRDKYVDFIVGDGMVVGRNTLMNDTECFLANSVANNILSNMFVNSGLIDIADNVSCLPSHNSTWIEFDINKNIYYTSKVENKMLERSVGIYIMMYPYTLFFQSLPRVSDDYTSNMKNFIYQYQNIARTVCLYNIFEVSNDDILLIGKTIILFDKNGKYIDSLVGTMYKPNDEIDCGARSATTLYSIIALNILSRINNKSVKIIDIGNKCKSIEDDISLGDFVKIALY